MPTARPRIKEPHIALVAEVCREYSWVMVETHNQTALELDDRRRGRPTSIDCQNCGEPVIVAKMGAVPKKCFTCRHGVPRKKARNRDLVMFLRAEHHEMKKHLTIALEEVAELGEVNRQLIMEAASWRRKAERAEAQVEALTKVATSIDGIER